MSKFDQDFSDRLNNVRNQYVHILIKLLSTEKFGDTPAESSVFPNIAKHNRHLLKKLLNPS